MTQIIRLRPAYGRILFSFLLGCLFLAACGTEEATPTPAAADTAVPATATAPPPTAVPTDAPTPEPTQTATAVPTTEPTVEPTTEPTPEPDTAAPTGAFTEADCEFDVPAGRDVTCGWLTVPEDRLNPDDERTVQLHVAIFASESDNPAPDPLVYLEGGPGGEPLEAIPFTFERLFAPYLAHREFIMFDQRGTGYSRPSLACPETRELTFELLEQDLAAEEVVELTKESLFRCRERLIDEGVNLAAYNSAANAADLHDLRLALGYEEWNLLGISYGTRLAQTTMRDHPQGLRSVILDSTYPLESNLLTDTPDSAHRAFDVFFAGCVADPACNEAYPELETTFFNVVDRLNEEKIDITVRDLLTGEEYDTTFGGDDLTGILFQTLYATEIIPGLPQLIYEIDAGNYATLSNLLSSFLVNGEFISLGMQFSVQCHEENLFANEGDVIAAAEKYPELANLFIYSLNIGPPALEVCAVWGAGEAGPIENEPVSSDIPTLVLAGEYDPITPPAWGQQVAAHLDNATFYEFPGTGHGVSISGACAVEVVESFLADPEATPDAGCLAEMAGPAFTVPGSEAAITLVPFANDDFGIMGLVPEGWQEVGPGVYSRGQSALDQTVLIQQAAPFDAGQLLDLLTTQLGLPEPPEASDTYETAARTWDLYAAEVQGLPVLIALAEEEGTTYVVLLISAADEQAGLIEAVFFPALEAFALQ